MRLEKFVEEIKKTYDTDLQSIILYGSAANGEFQKRYSDFNLLIILKEVSLKTLSRADSLSQKWQRSGNPIPLFVDQAHLETSLDVFPIEFFDMKDQHRVLHGTDPFATLTIDPKHLRLQCESEFKGKLIALRSEYLRLHPCKRKIKKLILRSSSAFFALFRGLLRLLGEPIPSTKRELLKRLNERTSFDTSVLERILEIREGKRDLARGEILGLAEEYLTTLDKVSSFVDTM